MDYKQLKKDTVEQFSKLFPGLSLTIWDRDTQVVQVVLTIEDRQILEDNKGNRYHVQQYPMPEEHLWPQFLRNAVEASIKELARRSPKLDNWCSTLRLKLWKD